jgi:CRISPR-associated protein (TIGR03986 family)
MLRSAYEAITNSRYGVFNDEHKKKLGLRLQAQTDVVPARVIAGDNGGLALKLFCGTSRINSAGKPDGSQFAAWIPAYGVRERHFPGHEYCVHGERVKAKLVFCKHQRQWTFWRVVAAAPVNQPLPHVSERDLPDLRGRWGYDREIVFKEVEGYVVKSRRLIRFKHDERLFFNINSARVQPNVPIPHSVQDDYNNLLADYRKVHEHGACPASGPGVVQGSHITDEHNLSVGDFVYVSFNNPHETSRTVRKIFPVQISRDLHDASPWDCLDSSLRPPTSLDTLSPAERLFGWVNADGQGAWRGKVRITSLSTSHPDQISAVARFQRSMPLTILGAPKPSQGRFYVGNRNGDAQPHGLDKKQVGYTRDKRIRGRKMYLTPRLLTSPEQAPYWTQPWEDRTQRSVEGYHQEYRQPNGNNCESNQNRSITGWIRQGTEIHFSLRVENLRKEEVGALLTLINFSSWAGKEAVLRLGMGKPFGLGCLQISLGEAPRIVTADKWQNFYKNLSAISYSDITTSEEMNTFQQSFQQEMATAFNKKNWTDLPFVRAFTAIAKGPEDNYPVHYPRGTDDRDPNNNETLSFKWFVSNEKSVQRQVPGYVLPNAANINPLPKQP